MKIPAVEPQVLLLGRLPHVALLALPRAGILRGVATESPHLADLVGDVLADEVGGPAVHRAVPGGVDDDVGRQLGAVGQYYRVLGEPVDLAVRQLDAAVGHQVAGADVDVVAGAPAQFLHEEAGIAVAPSNSKPAAVSLS